MADDPVVSVADDPGDDPEAVDDPAAVAGRAVAADRVAPERVSVEAAPDEFLTFRNP